MRPDGRARLFGEDVWCLGADSASADRLRGASIKYCYGDDGRSGRCRKWTPSSDFLDRLIDDARCDPQR